MERIHILTIVLAIILFALYLLSPSKPYEAQSKIHNRGLFADKEYQKGDIILDNVFPNKNNNEKLFNRVPTHKFKKYISHEGTLINHCTINYNTDLISKDHKIYKLIARKQIQKDQELTANYDIIHKNYPFIAKSKQTYRNC